MENISKNYRGNSVTGLTNVLMNLFFIIYSIICVAPLLLVLIVSLTDESVLLENGFSFFPKKMSLMAYKFVFDHPEKIINGYAISIFTTVVGTVISLLITSMLAYVLSRRDFKYRNYISFYVFFTMLMSGGLVPWFILYKNYLHLFNNIWVLIIPNLLNAWNVIIMRTFFSTTVPPEVVESAKIDGANELKIFFSIIVKISLPAFATIGLFTSLAYWNDWWLSLLFIVDENKMNLQYLMYKVIRNMQAVVSLSQNSRGDINLADLPTESSKMATAIIAIGPIIMAYPFVQKYFVKGLTIGAVKG